MPPIAQSGVLDLQAYLDSCSEDVRTLFEKECSVMLECRACKSIFRSFVNFFSHKRGFCRVESHENNESSLPSSPRKVGLRRTNIAKHVFKKIGVTEITGDDPSASAFVHTLPSHRREVVAVIDRDGTQRICLPTMMYDDSDIPPDRVLLLRPQVNAARYRSMNLRMRLKNDVTRPVSEEEVECIERILKYFPNLVEPTACRCLCASCADIVPFGSTSALAYHMSIKHTVREEGSNAIPCLLCPKKFITSAPFIAHVKRKHARVKLEHLAYRKKEAGEALAKKKGKRVRGKTGEQPSNICIRSRSLSPDPEEICETNDVSEENGFDGPPVLEPEDTKNQEEVASIRDSPAPEISCSDSSPSQPLHQLSPHIDDKEERSNTVCSNPSGDEEKPLSACALRKRRKRKIPARYRDDEFETYVKESDHSRSSSKLRRSSPLSSSSHTPEKSSSSTVARSDTVASDVSEVMRRLVTTVSDLLSEEQPAAPHPTTVRTKSSRLRKRPDWMDNEDFVIVDERKNRRESPMDHPVLRVYNSAETVPSHSSTKSVGSESNESGTSTPTLPKDTHNTSVKVTRQRRSPANLLDSVGNLSNRRKQNLNAINDVEDNVTILFKNGKPSKVDDLAMVPVYLSSAQKQLFFSSLKQIHPDEPDGKHICSQCNEVVPNLKEGRRHMVTHIRVMRLRCSLCGAGSFFCTDLRVHLMEGYCEKLHRAPEGVVDLDRHPCMTKEQADSLSELVDPINPGRVMYTSGQIVSAKSRIPYYPDPVIEERILGPGRVLCRSTPTRTKRT